MTLRLTDYTAELADLLSRTQTSDDTGARLTRQDAAEQAVQLVLQARLAQRKIMVVGNGGSAAIADHLHNDLCKAVGVRALAFHHTALLTALTNDEGYERAFERNVEQWAEPDDLLIAISSSGRSANILRAAAAALAAGARVITLSGFAPDNPLRALGELNFYIPSSSYGQVELAHSVLAHYLTDAAMAAISAHPASSQGSNDVSSSHQNRARDRRGRLRRGRASA